MFFTIFSMNNKHLKISSKYNCRLIKEYDGRCTGSANCNICRNCSRCAHCNSGGSCGVCGGGSNYYSTPKILKASKTKSAKYCYYPSSKIYYENEIIIIYNEIINLRKEPSAKSEIVQKIYLGDLVTFLEKEGEWLKVQVENTKNIGYIYAKLLN